MNLFTEDYSNEEKKNSCNWFSLSQIIFWYNKKKVIYIVSISLKLHMNSKRTCKQYYYDSKYRSQKGNGGSLNWFSILGLLVMNLAVFPALLLYIADTEKYVSKRIWWNTKEIGFVWLKVIFRHLCACAPETTSRCDGR